jgi:hypothetical protein
MDRLRLVDTAPSGRSSRLAAGRQARHGQARAPCRRGRAAEKWGAQPSEALNHASKPQSQQRRHIDDIGSTIVRLLLWAPATAHHSQAAPATARRSRAALAMAHHSRVGPATALRSRASAAHRLSAWRPCAHAWPPFRHLRRQARSCLQETPSQICGKYNADTPLASKLRAAPRG